MKDNFVFDHILHFSDFENAQLGYARQTPCIRIGVMKDNPFWTNLSAAATQPAVAALSDPYSESIVIIIMIIFNEVVKTNTDSVVLRVK